MRARTLLVLSVAALLTGACVGRGQLTRQHVPTGVPTAPPPDFTRGDSKKPFSDYVAWARTQVKTARARAGLKGSDEEAILDQRFPADQGMPVPFELAPQCPGGAGAHPSRGILLIHGLTDAPFVMRDVAARLRNQCFRVRAILLPGHGTVPGDLLEATYEQWVDAARYGIDSFQRQVAELYVAGFSTGGSLAIYHALQGDERARSIRALILFSPALEVADRWAFLGNVHRWLYSWWFPRGQWYGPILDEHDAAKYESFPKNAGYQVWRLTRAIAKLRAQSELKIPVFVAQSEDDDTVSSTATIEFFRAIKDVRPTRMLLFTRGPQPRAPAARLDQSIGVQPVRPGTGIVSSSHLAIPTAPGNAHYGQDGAYKNCLHYENANNEEPDPRWDPCHRGKPDPRCGPDASLKTPDNGVCLGEITPEIRDDYERRGFVVRRLTFNPDFDSMMQEIETFVGAVTAHGRPGERQQ